MIALQQSQLADLCIHRRQSFLSSICQTFGIGVGTGGGGGQGPPQYFTHETLLIFILAAQIGAIAVYITFGPPKMELLPTPMFGQCNINGMALISYSVNGPIVLALCA